MPLKRKHVEALKLGSFKFDELFEGQAAPTFLSFQEDAIVEAITYLHEYFPEDAYPTIPLKISDGKGGYNYIIYITPDHEI